MHTHTQNTHAHKCTKYISPHFLATSRGRDVARTCKWKQAPTLLWDISSRNDVAFVFVFPISVVKEDENAATPTPPRCLRWFSSLVQAFGLEFVLYLSFSEHLLRGFLTAILAIERLAYLQLKVCMVACGDLSALVIRCSKFLSQFFWEYVQLLVFPCLLLKNDGQWNKHLNNNFHAVFRTTFFFWSNPVLINAAIDHRLHSAQTNLPKINNSSL